jgi:hypothetical protein
MNPVWRLVALLSAVAAAITLLLTSPAATAEGLLARLRSDVRAPDPLKRPESKDKGGQDSDECGYDQDCDDDWYDDDDHNGDSAGVLGALTAFSAAVASSPLWGPPILIGDGYDYQGYFPEYPYQYERGYMMVEPADMLRRGREREAYTYAWRARSDYGTNFSGLSWIGGHLLLETTPRIGAETDFRFLQEELSTGGQDELWLGDANLFWRFAQSDQTQMRAGMGFNWLADREHGDFGVNFTYAIDWFPVRPIVISAEIDLGSLSDAWLFHVRTTAGASWRGLEAFVGYDLYDIDRFQAEGMVGGVRLWF